MNKLMNVRTKCCCCYCCSRAPVHVSLVKVSTAIILLLLLLLLLLFPADFDCDYTRCYAWILAAVLFLADRTEADALARIPQRLQHDSRHLLIQNVTSI